ncbi:hypothetical protein [Mycobacterium sp. SMC-4]|uniref:hypothetical protein n=1 Tax=Mycobacterium sp. SMC-4 TaxID=2857059 RepID=UPI0021B2F3BF|nr:hypothetical protein [Mycobacterium sp. SMC-4]UXA19559.1 hypothetical protein KXD98_08155 [Mycobacterium sp. SMC-4]
MAIIVDEAAGTISFTDCTVTFPYGFNVSTGVGTIIITPSGGVASFPLAIQGEGGAPPVINWVIELIGPDDPVPEPNPLVVIHDPGGPGDPVVQTNTIYIPRGPQGDPAGFNMLDAEDITGDRTDGYVLAKGPGATVVFVPLPTCDVRSSTGIEATAFNATNPRLLTTVTLASKPFPRKVLPKGSLVVTGSVDTRVDLVAYLGDPDSGGVEIGRGFGAAGAAPPPVVLADGPPNTPTGADASYGVIPAGEAGVVYFRAEQMAASSSGWATAAAPDGARCSAVGVPV